MWRTGYIGTNAAPSNFMHIPGHWARLAELLIFLTYLDLKDLMAFLLGDIVAVLVHAVAARLRNNH